MLAKCYTHVFAVPGRLSIIDAVHPVTGRSVINDETLAQIQARYPDAALIAFDDWQAGAVAQQHTPITWAPTTAAVYDEMLNVLPPAVFLHAGFLVGEPTDHDLATGRPRYAAYRCDHSAYRVASRPLTRQEFRDALAEEGAPHVAR